MAKRSSMLNNLENRFKVLNDNILNLGKYYKNQTFDVITTNPPYKEKDTGVINEDKRKLISRNEITASLEDFIKISFDLLKDKGDFYMVHRPDRLTDIFYLMRKYKIEPKKIRFVFSNEKQKPKLVLIKGVKNAKPFLTIEPNLYIYNDFGDYTEEILEIYNKK